VKVHLIPCFFLIADLWTFTFWIGSMEVHNYDSIEI
jgi:hypothetical protein